MNMAGGWIGYALGHTEVAPSRASPLPQVSVLDTKSVNGAKPCGSGLAPVAAVVLFMVLSAES